MREPPRRGRSSQFSWSVVYVGVVSVHGQGRVLMQVRTSCQPSSAGITILEGTAGPGQRSSSVTSRPRYFVPAHGFESFLTNLLSCFSGASTRNRPRGAKATRPSPERLPAGCISFSDNLWPRHPARILFRVVHHACSLGAKWAGASAIANRCAADVRPTTIVTASDVRFSMMCLQSVCRDHVIRPC